MGLFSLWGSKELAATPPTAKPVPSPSPSSLPPATQPADPTTSTPAPAFAPPNHDDPIPPYPNLFSKRSLKQLGFFFGGASFLALTVLTSRRAAARHLKLSRLKFYQPTHGGTYGIGKNGEARKTADRDPMIAFEALGLATLGTISFGIMGAGGMAWAFDFTNLAELRVKMRRSMYGDQGLVDEDAEREVAEWLTKMLEPKAKAEPAAPEEPKNS